MRHKGLLNGFRGGWDKTKEYRRGEAYCPKQISFQAWTHWGKVKADSRGLPFSPYRKKGKGTFQPSYRRTFTPVTGSQLDIPASNGKKRKGKSRRKSEKSIFRKRHFGRTSKRGVFPLGEVLIPGTRRKRGLKRQKNCCGGS